MSTKVVMEALSPTMEEGRLVEWKKQEGDTVAVGDVLAEVETDKAVMELVARAGGTLLKHVVSAGAPCRCPSSWRSSASREKPRRRAGGDDEASATGGGSEAHSASRQVCGARNRKRRGRPPKPGAAPTPAPAPAPAPNGQADGGSCEGVTARSPHRRGARDRSRCGGRVRPRGKGRRPRPGGRLGARRRHRGRTSRPPPRPPCAPAPPYGGRPRLP